MIHKHINKENDARKFLVGNVKCRINDQIHYEVSVCLPSKYNLEQVAFKPGYATEMFVLYALSTYINDEDSMYEIYDDGNYIISDYELRVLNGEIRDDYWRTVRLPDLFFHNLMNHVDDSDPRIIAKVLSGLYESDKMFRVIIFNKWGNDNWNFMEGMKA